jgi:hypothetical protein
MPGRHFLHAPGPTTIPDLIRDAMQVAMEARRGSVPSDEAATSLGKAAA